MMLAGAFVRCSHQLALAIVLALVLAALQGAAWGADTLNPVTQQLEQKKLREEIRKLQLENRNENGARGIVSSYAVLITGLVAVAGVLLTLWKQVSESSQQRNADRRQRELETQQRELESRRRFEEQFATALAGLGDESEATRAGAAVSLLTFLGPDESAFHRRVRLVTLANLKVQDSEPVRQLLVGVFQAAVRTPEKLEGLELDLSGAHLVGADLSEVPLGDARLGSADLTRANLQNVILCRAVGYKVILTRARLSGPKADLEAVRFEGAHAERTEFRDARLVSAHLEDAHLANAMFQRANLQAAHLEGADLRGARFEEANLADTYFSNQGKDAILDTMSARSITRAFNWERAHFSPDQKALVEASR